MSDLCRECRGEIDARTVAAGGEVCFDCATSPRATPTPGPWTVEPYDNTDLLGIYRVWEAQKRLCDEEMLPRFEDANAENQANARLIAAAPELLQALANAGGAFDAIMEYLGGICSHPPGTREDCYSCDAYASAERGYAAARALLARVQGEG